MEYVSMVLDKPWGPLGSRVLCCRKKKKVSETINSLVLWARQCPLVFLVVSSSICGLAFYFGFCRCGNILTKCKLEKNGLFDF